MKMNILWTNKSYFGLFTMFLSTVYFLYALYLIIATLFVEEIRNYGMSPLNIFAACLFIGIGLFRFNAGHILIRKVFDKELFKTVFAFVCFFEILFSSFWGFVLITETGLFGYIIVSAFVIYYIVAIMFCRKLKHL